MSDDSDLVARVEWLVRELAKAREAVWQTQRRCHAWGNDVLSDNLLEDVAPDCVCGVAGMRNHC